jgi:hypothetical protein
LLSSNKKISKSLWSPQGLFFVDKFRNFLYH